MKTPSFLKAWLLVLGGYCGMSALAADTITPEVPEAYEPFTVEIEFPYPGRILSPFYLDISDNTILIGYNSRPILFIPPDKSWLLAEIPGLPPGTYVIRTAYISDIYDEELIVDDVELNLTVAGTESPTQQAHAFFHTGNEHFFVTADDDEADGLLAQSGWEIVDFGFNVWHADDPAPEAAVPVCRFYSEQVNSHFYTGDEAECTLLQEEDHGWEYEGIAFQALVPQDGACPAGTDSVWRLFNNRVAQLDSNHRFVASSETYRAMIAKGWLGEGVAFCSPPATVIE